MNRFSEGHVVHSSLQSPSGIGRQSDEKLAVPNRYRIKEDAKGRILTCTEAPTVAIRAVRGVTITAAAARNYTPGTIFLDGAAQGGPFADATKALYNLDHHEGCVRAFTLSTCEQAMVLIRKVLDLRRRDWTVVVNDADLDTVLAVWVLLNHLRLNEDADVRSRIMPLLRLEGAIDAHGLDLQDLAALSSEQSRTTAAALEKLREKEALLKRVERWRKVYLLEYIARQLRSVDELIYTPDSFEDVEEVEELARTEIARGSVAVACRSRAGIYELERQLRKIHGERLGMIILQKDPSTYTLRLVDQMLRATLDTAYERLNLVDPAAGSRRSPNRWGGSTEIGGSPRATGSRLTPAQITEAVRQAFRKPTLIDVLSTIPRAVFLTVAALFPALVLLFLSSLSRYRAYFAGEAPFLCVGILALTVGALFLLEARRRPRIHGCQAPVGFGWLLVVPTALIGAMAGGVWLPESLGYFKGLGQLTGSAAAAVVFLPLSAEILFRGLILGDLALRLPVQTSGSPWSISWPTAVSSALYAFATLLPFLSSPNGWLEIDQPAVTLGAALIFGIALGVARERSESILTPIVLHWLCAAAVLLSGEFLF